MTQFDRVIRAEIQLANPPPSLGYRGNLRIDGLRMNFNITKTVASNTDTAQLTIWNLSQSNRKELEYYNDQIRIYAGYKESGGSQLIFIGDSSRVSHTWAEPEFISSFNIVDGLNTILGTITNITFSAGTSVRAALQTVIQNAGLTIAYFAPTPAKIYDSAASFSSSTRKVINTIVENLGMVWNVANGDIIITYKDDSNPKPPVEINVDTGMLGIPERYTDRRSQTLVKALRPGYKVRTLLNPSILPKDTVRIRSEVANISGDFVVEKITHIGDNYGDSFESIIEVFAS